MPASMLVFFGCTPLYIAATSADALTAKYGTLVLGYSAGMMTFGALVSKPLVEQAATRKR